MPSAELFDESVGSAALIIRRSARSFSFSLSNDAFRCGPDVNWMSSGVDRMLSTAWRSSQPVNKRRTRKRCREGGREGGREGREIGKERAGVVERKKQRKNI